MTQRILYAGMFGRVNVFLRKITIYHGKCVPCFGANIMFTFTLVKW